MLIPVILLTTAGVAITLLYCKGKVSEIGINVTPCCKNVNKGGCCNTETKIYKVKDAFVSFASFELNKLVDLYISPVKIDIFSWSEISINLITNWDKAPPLDKGELYILFRSLII